MEKKYIYIKKEVGGCVAKKQRRKCEKYRICGFSANFKEKCEKWEF